ARPSKPPRTSTSWATSWPNSAAGDRRGAWRTRRDNLMDKDKLVKRLMATFLDELDEHVRALNHDLLALEKSATHEEQGELLKKLFRTAHSLKGASRSVSVGLLETVCHQLEEILAAARDGRAALGPDQFALLFETADGIEEAGMRLREQQDLRDAPL